MEQIGRYQVERKLGEGGMGVVYLARDPVLGREVAIKTIRVSDLAEPQEQEALRRRFLNEARSLAQFSHPAIVTMHDFFEQNGLLFIVMEYVGGQSLAFFLANSQGPLPTKTCTRVLRDVASGLDYAHSRNIVHRDIKPANLLLHPSGMMKITDFGVAKLITTSTRSATGIVGTLDFMSPEQIRGEAVDGRSDQFSLAVVAYRMLTGQKLFDVDTFYAMSYKICTETPVLPSVRNPELPSAVDMVLLRALAKAREERFPTCGEFVASLEAALATPKLEPKAPVIAPAAPVPQALPEPAFGMAFPAQSSSRRTIAILGAAGAAIVLLGVGLFLLSGREHPTQPAPAPVVKTEAAAEVQPYKTPEPAAGPTVEPSPSPSPSPSSAPPKKLSELQRAKLFGRTMPDAIVTESGTQPPAVKATPSPTPTSMPVPGSSAGTVTPTRIRVGGNVQQAKLIRQPKPIYPSLAKQARIQGIVRLTVIIGKDGVVKTMQLITGHPLLVPAAMEAVKQWVYQPTLVNGEPVEVITQADVYFTLSQ